MPAVYHVRRDNLGRLDNVQSQFLRDAGIDEASALLTFNLAPLSTRRDIAMLGVIHRTVLGLGPPHFQKHFKLATAGTGRHSRHLEDPRQEYRARIVCRTVLGVVAV